ncbi:complement C2-like [Branchiostoma floridae x Branchiostoma japonicum]
MKFLRRVFVLLLISTLVLESEAVLGWIGRGLPPFAAAGCFSRPYTTRASGKPCKYRPSLTCYNYNCYPGCVRVSGDATRFCVYGNWTGTDIICEGSCCSSPPIPKGTYTDNCTSPYADGAVCTYRCAFWHIPDSGSTTKTCSNGVWTGDDLVCKRKDGEPPGCSVPPNPANAIRTYCSSSPPTSHGVYCKYECILGYFRRGGNVLRTCKNGVWDGRDAVCVRVCPSPAYMLSDPMYILDGVPMYKSSDYGIPISIATRSDCHFPYLPGARCSFWCNPGFIPLYGSKTRTCSNGNWTGTPLFCRHVSHWRFLQNRQWDLD